jgi:hypothetical protein
LLMLQLFILSFKVVCFRLKGLLMSKSNVEDIIILDVGFRDSRISRSMSS